MKRTNLAQPSLTSQYLITSYNFSCTMTQLEHSNNKILGNKLYVALEDSMDESIDPKGAVVVFDISQGLQQPKLIKTLTAGNGLPPD